MHTGRLVVYERVGAVDSGRTRRVDTRRPPAARLKRVPGNDGIMDHSRRLLERRINHVRAWCARHESLSYPFDAWSSTELSPVPPPERRRLIEASEDVLLRGDDPFAMVERVCTRRANAFNTGHVLHLEPMAAGRIMAFRPYLTLSHGTEEHASDGFLNAACGPPWDTWLVLRSTDTTRNEGPELLSWVPQPLVDLVDEAIRINIEECIYWHDT